MKVFVIKHLGGHVWGVASSQKAAEEFIARNRVNDFRAESPSDFEIRKFDVFEGVKIIDDVKFEGHGRVSVKGICGGEEFMLFQYYSDELTFSKDEIVGKSVEQARSLFHEKDVAYLRS